jgi:hypothetical protein
MVKTWSNDGKETPAIRFLCGAFSGAVSCKKYLIIFSLSNYLISYYINMNFFLFINLIYY